MAHPPSSIWLQGTLRLCLSLFLLLAGLSNSWGDSHADIQRLIEKGKSYVSHEQVPKGMRCFFEAHELATTNKDHSGEFWAQYHIGSAYFSILENGEALNHYYEALKVCNQYDLGMKERSDVLRGIAGVYYEQENFDKAKSYMQKAFEYCKQTNDNDSYIACACDLALIATRMGKFAESQHYSQLGWQHLKKGDIFHWSRIKVIEAFNMYKQHNYTEAEKLCKEVLQKNAVGVEDKAVMMHYLANIYMERGQMQLAKKYIHQAMAIVPLRNKPEVFSTASNLYQKLGDLDSALQFKDSLLVTTDSLNKINNRQLVENSSVKIELLKMNLDMERKAMRLKRHTYIAIVLVLVCLLIIVMGWFMVRNERIRNRQAHQLMDLKLEKEKRDKELAKTQMRETELMAKYQKQLLQTSLEKKQRELSATAVFVSTRNQLITELLKQFADVPESERNPEIKQIMQNLQQVLHRGEENEAFYVKFESENPDFVKHLEQRHPELSTSDIHFLSYVRMNLSMKDIAQFLNISPDSCKRRKTRISKKLGLKDASELYNYIATF
ncbi:MAG: tetratricopeptide repeat protein [Prevotella sp.]|jgi:tetratricopeptide (TPR) repeat protein